MELSSKSPGVLEDKWVTLEMFLGSKEMKDKGFTFKSLLNLLFSNFKIPLIRRNNTGFLLLDGITETEFITLPSKTTRKDKT